MKLILLIGVLALIAAGAFLVVGRERVWEAFGPADLGDADFATLQRRTSPNDALACPDGVCTAKAEIVPRVFAVDAAALRAAFARALANEPHLTRVAADEAKLTERYVQRTPLMRYPDTIVVRFLPLGQGRSTLALYSRSKLGHSDLGANKARLQRWLAKLAEAAPVAR